MRATFAPPTPADPVAVELMPPTPATADLLCWLWAAIPPKDGRLHIARAAEALKVSDSTLRRWIKAADNDRMPEQARRALPRMRQLAILRGKGQLLWPPLDQASRDRQAALVREAQRALTATIEQPDVVPVSWLTRHTLYLVHYRSARVYGLASGSTDDTARKIKTARGEIVRTLDVENRHAARLAKAAVLEQVADARCIPPRAMIPTGRTETWRDDADLGPRLGQILAPYTQPSANRSTPQSHQVEAVSDDRQ